MLPALLPPPPIVPANAESVFSCCTMLCTWQKLDRFEASRALEYSWHVFFGEPWEVPNTDPAILFSKN